MAKTFVRIQYCLCNRMFISSLLLGVELSVAAAVAAFVAAFSDLPETKLS